MSICDISSRYGNGGDFGLETTVKGSQFKQPLMEFSGACAGCGETPYYKLVSQLFGKDMLVANATGCSSIYTGSTPSTPCNIDANGQGPAWANSLFEDNAQHGLGMQIGQQVLREQAIASAEKCATSEQAPAELKAAWDKFIETKQNTRENTPATAALVAELEKAAAAGCPDAKAALDKKDYLAKKSVWIFGGDGWAYDIGYGGLDHVLANNLNVNVLVLDTEVYSNTGGQSSKSSQAASIAKFTAGGKPTAKKDLGQIAMAYGHVYVASISMGANKAQTLKAIKEAESYDGPSLIIAYSPCANHGIKGGLANHQKVQAKAVECGYVTLYRFDPRKEQPLTIDSKAPDFDKFNEFLLNETRYTQLVKLKGDKTAYEMFEITRKDAEKRYNRLVKLAQD